MSAENLTYAFNNAAGRVQATRSPVPPYVRKNKPPVQALKTPPPKPAIKSATTPPHPMLELRIDLMAAANRKKR